jgi:glucokinase
MSILVADVGGTNTRFALCDSAIIPGTLARYSNETQPGFEAALASYLAEQGNPRLSALCVAVAGPVSSGRAELTNRGWRFDARTLTETTGARARLINDLAALGHAVPGLGPESAATIWDAPPELREGNGQALVLGLGTGVNACAVKVEPGRPAVCLEAEAGHTSMPVSVHTLLVERLGQVPEAFHSTEELFAGRGIARLHGCLTGAELAGDRLLDAARAGDPAARETWRFFAHLVGTYAREMALQYMPREGLYLAGSVSRGLVDAGMSAEFLAAYTAPQRFGDLVRGMSVLVITDDMAALSGCLAAA